MERNYVKDVEYGDTELKWLKETFVDPTKVFTHASDIEDETFLAWGGKPERTIIVYGDFTREEIEIYKNEVIKAGDLKVKWDRYEDIGYQFGACTKDEKWDLVMMETSTNVENRLGIAIFSVQ